LIKTQQTNQWQDVAYIVVMTISWMTAIGSVLLLTWFHVPAGLSRANARAQKLLAIGEQQSDESQRLTMYRRAVAIATDPHLEAELESLIEQEALSPQANSNTGVTNLHRNVPSADTVHGFATRGAKQSDALPVDGLSGRYELVEKIGSGAMGLVYSAWDKVLDRKVAIKQLSMILSGDSEYVLRFRREAKALARLNHLNVVQVYDLLEEDNRFWMVVEYLDGGDLASYLEQSGRLSVSQAVNMIIPVAEGLALAHRQGIVHRDLKPANILLTSAQTPKITDFGIAKLSQSGDLTQTGSVLGSPPYMSPEQCSGGSVDSRTDIYALGITLYELLTGEKPFDGDTSSVLARHIVEQPAPLTEHVESIPERLENLVLQMLSKNPDERPSDMAGVAESLSRFKDGVLSLERS
jgi:hypothetical protein